MSRVSTNTSLKDVKVAEGMANRILIILNQINEELSKNASNSDPGHIEFLMREYVRCLKDLSDIQLTNDCIIPPEVLEHVDGGNRARNPEILLYKKIKEVEKRNKEGHCLLERFDTLDKTLSNDVHNVIEQLQNLSEGGK